MLVVMTGLPGSGKSTVAAGLARRLPALIIDKDVVRAGLFPPTEIEYTTRQDDFCVDIMCALARFYFEKDPQRILIFDGRPYNRRYQVERVVSFTASVGQPVRFIHCTCSDATARARLDHAQASGAHVAANRDFALYQHMQSQAEPLEVPHLRLDTDQDLELCVNQCLAYLIDR